MSKKLNKILGESIGLSEEVREQIQEAWEDKLTEARDEITAELREEFARKFEHDKGVLAESIDKFLTDKISLELNEFAEDKKKVVQERKENKKRTVENINLLNKFVTQQVVKEVKELHSDKTKMKENFVKLENFLLKQLSEEIHEFRKDKNALVEQRVKMVTEGKEHLSKTKNEFIRRAAKVVETKINEALRNELSQFKEDIKEARQNDFGRKIFEAFVGEYMVSYLNENTEVSRLQSIISEKDKSINELTESVKQRERIAEGLEHKLTASKDQLQRNKVLNEMLAPLAKEKRGVMKELLETVQTKDLEKAYNKYLPAVLNESVPAKSKSSKETLTESAKLSEKTGNRAPQAQAENDNDLSRLKILAGLK